MKNKCEGINIVVINCDDKFIEYEWSSGTEFLRAMESDDENIPMLDDRISTANVHGFICDANKLEELGITTVNDFVAWCRETF